MKNLIYIKKFFPEGTYVEFDNEETIIDIINHYLEDSESLEKITTKAQEFIYENHYWKNRIDKFKSELDLLITLYNLLCLKKIKKNSKNFYCWRCWYGWRFNSKSPYKVMVLRMLSRQQEVSLIYLIEIK